MKGVLSAPAGPHRTICGDTDTPPDTDTPRGASCEGTTLIFVIFTQPPSMSPPTLPPRRVSMSLCPLTGKSAGQLGTMSQNTHV